MEQEQTIVEATPQTTTIQPPHRKHTKPSAGRQKVLFIIRQVLNILFMILGIIGAVMYSGIMGDGRIELMGGIIVIIAISMKMAECVIRCMKTK